MLPVAATPTPLFSCFAIDMLRRCAPKSAYAGMPHAAHAMRVMRARYFMSAARSVHMRA